MIELNHIELQLLRLVLDPGAYSNEVETSRQKLLESLAKRGLNGHDLVEALEANNRTDQVPPQMSKPDYGLCRMPFGKSKGQLFMDLSPYDLRSAQRWALSTSELAQKFAEFIHDVDQFLNQNT